LELGEHFGNLMITSWELDETKCENIWNIGKTKKMHPLHHPKLKISAALSLLIGCMKFLFSKQFIIIFTLD
jgi:hypothetical protein